MNSWCFFEGSPTSAIVRRQGPAGPGQVMLNQQQLEQAASFLLACQWPKIVQPRSGWRHARRQPDFLLLFGTCGDSLSGTATGGRRRRVDQSDRSFLSLFFHFQSKNSAETWNDISPRWKEHFGAKNEKYISAKNHASDRSTPALRQDPPGLGFWSFLTFLHRGIEEVERHLLWKFHNKIQRKSWSPMMCHRYCSLA